MRTNHNTSDGEYALATGRAAVRRLHVLHNIYAPAGRRALLQAGLSRGMKVVDFGCGVGVTTRMLADLVGPSGSVTGIDADEGQIQQASELWRTAG
jgi:2-polyprenyl-3-methyl-5-hydroxy-6-metoxy-1,4-benzoquinol methylase